MCAVRRPRCCPARADTRDALQACATIAFDAALVNGRAACAAVVGTRTPRFVESDPTSTTTHETVTVESPAKLHLQALSLNGLLFALVKALRSGALLLSIRFCNDSQYRQVRATMSRSIGLVIVVHLSSPLITHQRAVRSSLLRLLWQRTRERVKQRGQPHFRCCAQPDDAAEA